MLKYLQQKHESSLPVQPPPPNQSDASAGVPTLRDTTTNKTGKQVPRRPVELARPGGAKIRSGAASGNNAFNSGNARNRPSQDEPKQVTLLPLAVSQLYTVYALEDVHVHLAKLPAELRSDALLEIAANVQSVPVSMRSYVFDYLCNQIHDVYTRDRPAYMSEMAQSLGSLPFEDARSGMWAVLAKSLQSVVGEAALKPTIALIDAINHVPHHRVRGDHLNLLLPIIIGAEPHERNMMTDRLIRSLPHVAPGNDRTNFIEQIKLLLLNETSPAIVSAHLNALTAQSRCFAPEDNFIHFLQQITELSWNLPGPERCTLLAAIPEEFGYWHNTTALKAAVLMISRQAQSASADVQHKLAGSVGAGLSNVLDNLVRDIDRNPVAHNTAANVDGWLQAAAFTFGTVREPVSKAAMCLVELAWSKNHPAKEAMLASYGNAFSLAARKQLEVKLGIAT